MIFLTSATCSAENVHAVGRGITERMAIHDAMRTAIEKKFGAAVHSKTRVKNSMITSDDNSVDSAGLVQSWEIISNHVENGIYIVELNIELDDTQISTRLGELEKRLLSTSTPIILAWQS